MNELMTFHFEDHGVRTLTINDEPWFVGRDVAAALGYTNTRDALAKHVDKDDKNTVAIHDGIKGNPNATVINESGLYALIFGSKLDSAKRFKRWVTSEVLPEIRRTGSFQAKQPSDEVARIQAETKRLSRILALVKACGYENALKIIEAAPEASKKPAASRLKKKGTTTRKRSGIPPGLPQTLEEATSIFDFFKTYTPFVGLSVYSAYDAYCVWCKNIGHVEPLPLCYLTAYTRDYCNLTTTYKNKIRIFVKPKEAY